MPTSPARSPKSPRAATPPSSALHAQIPESLSALLRVPGLGPKRVALLHRQLGIETLEQLHRAALDGRIRALRGFSEKRERDLLDALAALRAKPGRFKLVTAAAYVGPLLAYLKAAAGVGRVIAAGSFRRCRETVGDIDILATAPVSEPIMRRFTAYDAVRDVLAAGPSRSTVILRPGLQVDLRVVPEHSYGAALHYFTGRKAHNIAIRRLGQEHGLKINEYGVFHDEERIAGETEELVFATVGLPWIPPELREGRGEIEAARAGGMPKLVTCEDLRGDLHVHTTATDGHNTVREMAEAARTLGLDYIAITEHSRRVAVACRDTPRREPARSISGSPWRRRRSGVSPRAMEASIFPTTFSGISTSSSALSTAGSISAAPSRPSAS